MTSKCLFMGKRFAYSLAFVCLLVLAGGVQARGQSILEGETESSEIISDSSGAIAEIMLQYDPDLADELWPFYRDLLAGLARDIRVLVICPSELAALEFIKTWKPLLEGHEVQIINAGLPISIWARDRYVSRQCVGFGKRSLGFVPVGESGYEEEKYNDLLILEMLGQSRVMPLVLDSSLQIEGGNVVSNGRHVFVGANVIDENGVASEEELADELGVIAGREILLVGDRHGEVPWCHIDMYLTPIGDNTILVASPRMAEMIRLGHCDGDMDCVDKTWFESCSTDSFQQCLDDVAKQMQRNGYQVLRLPAVVNASEYAMVTYNNVIVDYRGGVRTVYMPTYGFPVLDSMAAAIYRSLGFEVKTVDVSQIYLRGGAVRCLTNVTERHEVGFSRLSQTKHRAVQFRDLPGSTGYGTLLERSDKRLMRRGHRRCSW